MVKKSFRFFLAFAVLASLVFPFLTKSANFEEEKPDLHFFWTPSCPYCNKQKIFLEEIALKYPDLKIYGYNLYESNNVEKLKGIMKDYQGSERYLGSVPLTFIGKYFFVGFSEEIGEKIENSIKNYYEEDGKEKFDEEDIFYLPVLGQIDPQKWSLGTLAVVIGSIDGLNICSLGALVVILILVFTLHSRKLTIIFGGLFIFISALVYGFLVFLWHQLFSIFLPYMPAMKIIIGLFAFFGGLYFLKQFFEFRKKGPVCQFEKNKIIVSLSKKLENSFKEKRNILFLMSGVILFAATVTVIEFPCSAVFPVVFSGILAQAKISLLASIFYIIVYLFFYMLIEIVVFLIAVFTRKIWIAYGPFMTYMSFIGALVLFFISYYYVFVL